jgi:hypothetical protein
VVLVAERVKSRSYLSANFLCAVTVSGEMPTTFAPAFS